MEVVGESVPIVYFDELTRERQILASLFAFEVALRFRLIPRPQFSPRAVINGVPLGQYLEPDPNLDLTAVRANLIAGEGFDPLQVLPGPRNLDELDGYDSPPTPEP